MISCGFLIQVEWNLSLQRELHPRRTQDARGSFRGWTWTLLVVSVHRVGAQESFLSATMGLNYLLGAYVVCSDVFCIFRPSVVF